jgi:hypothetical protein
MKIFTTPVFFLTNHKKTITLNVYNQRFTQGSTGLLCAFSGYDDRYD